MLLQMRRGKMNISVLSVMPREMKYPYFHKQQFFTTQITHLSHIRDTSCNNFVGKKDHVPAKFNPWFEMYLYIISEIKTKRLGKWRESFLWSVLRIREAPMPFAFHFPSLSLLRQTVAVVLRLIFHRKAHKWKHPNLGNLIAVTNSTFPKGHLKTSLFVPRD